MMDAIRVAGSTAMAVVWSLLLVRWVATGSPPWEFVLSGGAPLGAWVVGINLMFAPVECLIRALEPSDGERKAGSRDSHLIG